MVVVGVGYGLWWWWCAMGSGCGGLCSIYYCLKFVFFPNVILMCSIYYFNVLHGKIEHVM